MVDNFPFANIRSEAAIFNNTNWYPDVVFISRIIVSRFSTPCMFQVLLLATWDAWFVIHEAKLDEEMKVKEGRLHGIFNGMHLFLLIAISFLSYRETAGDPGLPKDSNTVVGKPQLGEQNCNF